MMQQSYYKNAKPIGQRFLNLGLFDLVYVVTFSLSQRKFIYEFLNFIKADTEFKGEVDLYFVVEVIHVKFNYNELPTFLAVFEFTPRGHYLLNLLRKIGMCEILKIEFKFIKSLFILLSSISFREYKMFETLKVSRNFRKCKLSNPFAQTILEKNVLKIANVEQTIFFQLHKYDNYILKRKHIHNRIRQPQQDEIQTKLYGKSYRHFQVHLNDFDHAFLKKIVRNGSKINRPLSTMIDEDKIHKEAEVDIEESLISSFKQLGLHESRSSRSRSRSNSSQSSRPFSFSQSTESLSNSDGESNHDDHYRFSFRV